MNLDQLIIAKRKELAELLKIKTNQAILLLVAGLKQ